MPKAEKPNKSKSSRNSNNPINPSRQSLDTELKQLEDPGKLKPIKPNNNDTKTTKKSNNREENMVDNVLSEDELDNSLNYIPKQLSKKILAAAQSQQNELEEENEDMNDNGDIEIKSDSKKSKSKIIIRGNKNIKKPIKDRDSDLEEEEDYNLNNNGEDLEEYEDIEINEEDERSLAMFLPESNKEKRTLSDMIFEQLEKVNKNIGNPNNSSCSVNTNANEQPLDNRIIQVYTEVSVYLKHYSSGKIPKAFKIIPTLRNWEQILLLTKPDEWTVQAVSAATRLFASNLNPKMAQRFYNTILLPRVRFDIENHKKLNYHLYLSCKRAIYKPAAFFKGLLLPLAADECTVREAVILSSILSKCSIPLNHAAAAILKLTELNMQNYSGTTSLLIKTLLNKKYSLPYRVLDTLMEFFSQFISDDRTMPLIWHQFLLVFVQRYKTELNETQQQKLRLLCKKQVHQQITPDIKRELAAANLLKLNGPIDTSNMTIMQIQQQIKQQEKTKQQLKHQNNNNNEMEM